MTENKIYAVKRNDIWSAVIDCGETKVGGFTVGNFWMNHFKKDGRTYRRYATIFMPPADLVEWQEIKCKQSLVTIIVDENNDIFEGFEEKENEGLIVLQKFANLIGKRMTIEEIEELVTKNP